jgi:transposase
VKDFLDDNYIKLHPHPPNSSDLNPIELIWAKLKSDVEKIKPSTKQGLHDTIFASWEALSPEVIKFSIDHLVGYIPSVAAIN